MSDCRTVHFVVELGPVVPMEVYWSETSLLAYLTPVLHISKDVLKAEAENSNREIRKLICCFAAGHYF